MAELTNGLISYWKLNEGLDTNWDTWGTNHLMEGGLVTQAAGKIGNAASFDNANDEYIGLPSNATFNVQTFTFTAWVNLSSKGLFNREILTKWGSTDRQFDLQFFETGDRFRWLVSPDGTANTNVQANAIGSPVTGVWYFIVAWHDSANNLIGIQVNNGPEETVPHTTDVNLGSLPFRIGARDNIVGDAWDGIIDEVGFWGRILTADEKTAIYNNDQALEFHPETWCGIGGVTDSEASYRAKSDDSATTFAIEYSLNSDLSGSQTSPGTGVDSSKTGGETITGLSPDTLYYYSPITEGHRMFHGTFPMFRTMPSPGSATPLVICFSSCNLTPDAVDLYDSVQAESPNLFLHLGDFGYPDSTEIFNQRTNYRRQMVTSSNYCKRVQRHIGVERVWDDHDYGANNSAGGLPGKENSLQVWKEYTPAIALHNPSNGLWRNFTVGSIEFFMLDTRYQRENNQQRFPSFSGNTADVGSSGSTLVLRASDSPSGANGFYDGWYVLAESQYRRVTNYVGATRTATLDTPIVPLSSSSTYALKKASILDMDYIADNQVDWLIDAVNKSTATWKVIISSIAFNGTVVTPGLEDSWGDWDLEQFERNYLIQALIPERLFVISGDRHFSGIDDGTNSDWPEISASPIDQTNRTVEGSWSNGADNTGGFYGVITLRDTGDIELTVKRGNGSIPGTITPITLEGPAPDTSIVSRRAR